MDATSVLAAIGNHVGMALGIVGAWIVGLWSLRALALLGGSGSSSSGYTGTLDYNADGSCAGCGYHACRCNE